MPKRRYSRAISHAGPMTIKCGLLNTDGQLPSILCPIMSAIHDIINSGIDKYIRLLIIKASSQNTTRIKNTAITAKQSVMRIDRYPKYIKSVPVITSIAPSNGNDVPCSVASNAQTARGSNIQ